MLHCQVDADKPVSGQATAESVIFNTRKHAVKREGWQAGRPRNIL